ncbi:hypothetical protein C8034_v011519 [Colletotrichum sidae]|uniref:Uncharacterized protein n=1 Tax=Colletotrichum sidae TaxID=1347389 RepID=A0A4R8TJC9_9PEZI|nr:hypothetical protein C8034_v011519 [Colletotrichum sidae]
MTRTESSAEELYMTKMPVLPTQEGRAALDAGWRSIGRVVESVCLGIACAVVLGLLAVLLFFLSVWVSVWVSTTSHRCRPVITEEPPDHEVDHVSAQDSSSAGASSSTGASASTEASLSTETSVSPETAASTETSADQQECDNTKFPLRRSVSPAFSWKSGDSDRFTTGEQDNCGFSNPRTCGSNSPDDESYTCESSSDRDDLSRHDESCSDDSDSDCNDPDYVHDKADLFEFACAQSVAPVTPVSEQFEGSETMGLPDLVSDSEDDESYAFVNLPDSPSSQGSSDFEVVSEPQSPVDGIAGFPSHALDNETDSPAVVENRVEAITGFDSDDSYDW